MVIHNYWVTKVLGQEGGALWPSVMVAHLRNTDMSTTTPQTRGRHYTFSLTRHARIRSAAAVLLGPSALPV